MAMVLVTSGASLLAGGGSALATEDENDPGRTRTVLVTRVDDPITPVIADHLGDALDRAEEGGHVALVIELDTPGGLSESMRDIVQDLLGAEVPVVVHVTPAGARAASAGALIAWSAHVVAMAPGTTIGAATPVDLEGGEVGDKIVEDAAAYARAVAEERGRDVDLAAATVTEGRAFSASEAIAADLADLVASDRAQLLSSVHGTTVTLANGERATLDTAAVTVQEYDMTFLRSVLQVLADPNLAFLFLSIGSLGLIYELASPGVGAGGGIGALLILLGLVSLSVLPVEAAGLLFFVLAAALFVAELFAPGIGIAAALGALAMVFAAIFTFREDAPGVSLSLAAVVPTAAVVGLAVIGAGRLAMRARGGSPTTGASALVGQTLVAEHVSAASVQGRLDGSWWTLRSEEPLEAGDRVQVIGVEGVELLVEHEATDQHHHEMEETP
jgi:membrane-bound serine protease (ClpP class)